MTWITKCLASAILVALALTGCTLSRDSDGSDNPITTGVDAGWPWPDDGGGRVPDGGWQADASTHPDDGGPLCDCPAITIEAVCLFSPGCTPLYVGNGCSCEPSGECDCTDWTFARCE